MNIAIGKMVCELVNRPFTPMRLKQNHLATFLKIRAFLSSLIVRQSKTHKNQTWNK